MTPGEWLRDLFGSDALRDQWLTVCWRENRLRWHHVPVADLDRPARGLSMYADTTCTWLGCCPLIERPVHGRGRTDDTGALVGVWADLDIAGDGHADHGPLPLPPTIDDALEILDRIGIEPTHTLHTGGGLQVWWLFTEPWLFTDAADRLTAQAVSAGFGRTLQDYGRTAGWQVDDVSDLARILRPPGTRNWKQRSNPRPVTRIGGSGRRVLIADIEDSITEPTIGSDQLKSSTAVTTADDGPAGVFARHAQWSDVLAPHGWQPYRFSNGQPALGSICPTCGDRVQHWSHPQVPLDHRGWPDHPSATACHVLYLFTESRPNGLPPRTPLTKFRTWALLDHDGDLSAAARSILSATRQVLA